MTVLCGKSPQEINNIVHKINDAGRIRLLKLNARKIKLMVVGDENADVSIDIDGETIAKYFLQVYWSHQDKHGQMPGKRRRGCPRMQYIDDIKKWTRTSLEVNVRLTEDRTAWRERCCAAGAANVRTDDAD